MINNKESNNKLTTNNSDTKVNSANDLDRNVTQINGPINVVRMEGNVGSIKKVIFLFMDIHVNISDQTQCTNIYAKDVDQYFADNFYNLNSGTKMYDFFLEIRPTDIYRLKQWNKNKQIYIQQMALLFSTILSYDKNKNKVNVSELLKNIRLHYLDIRDYLYFHIDKFIEQANNISYQMLCQTPSMSFIDQSYLSEIIDNLTNAKQQLDLTIDLLIKPENIVDRSVAKDDQPSSQLGNYKEPLIKDIELTNNKEFAEFIPSIVSRTAYKLINLYNHPHIKKLMNKLLNDLINNFKKLSNDIGFTIAELKNYQKTITNVDSYRELTIDNAFDTKYKYTSLTKLRHMIINIIDMCDKISFITLKVFARFTDIYFLRRFLDKDYITNAIVYSGASHSLNYIEILIKYLDFKITHVAYSSINNIEDLMKETKSRLNQKKDLMDLFEPSELIQCSNISYFPKNFE